MDQNIVEQLQNIAEAISKSAPDSKLSWASFIISCCSLIATIILTGCLIYITRENNLKNQELQKKLYEDNESLQYKIHEENERIQITIHNTETKLKFYEVILSIYRSYTGVLELMTYCNKNFISKIVYPAIFQNWFIQINNTTIEFIRAYNHAKIIFLHYDNELFQQLELIYKKYSHINILIQEYIETGKLSNLHDHAWDTICRTTGIQKYDSVLITNTDISEKMKNILLTKETIEIQNNIDELLEMFEYDNFDRYFEPYLSFDKFGERSATQQDN